MKRILPLFLCTFCFLAFSQKEEDNVMKVVNQVFEAMRTNDSTLLKQSFVQSPNMFTSSSNQDGKSILTEGNFQRFVDAIGSPKDQVFNEPIWNEKIQIDGNFAAVWVDYAFYLDDQFSHCGVDAFHLVKLDDQWKIFHLIDTRRKTPCDIPDEIKP